MDTYEVEVETCEPDRVVLTVPALPGLLILGRSIEEVLHLAEQSIAFHAPAAGVRTAVRACNCDQRRDPHCAYSIEQAATGCAMPTARRLASYRR